MPQHVTYAEVTKVPRYVTYTNMLKSSFKRLRLASRNILASVKAVICKNSLQVGPTIRPTGEAPGRNNVQILRHLLPPKINVQIYNCDCIGWLWWAVDGYDRHEREFVTNLLLICKDLSACLGPMMFSRIEVTVLRRLWGHDTIDEARTRRRRTYDRAVSSLHRSLVEKYDRRVWVDGPDRDRELGLFRARGGRTAARKDDVIGGGQGSDDSGKISDEPGLEPGLAWPQPLSIVIPTFNQIWTPSYLPANVEALVRPDTANIYAPAAPPQTRRTGSKAKRLSKSDPVDTTGLVITSSWRSRADVALYTLSAATNVWRRWATNGEVAILARIAAK
ncbi:uncharacterized protein AB675_8937 [Cyphellophora attinorum]|uniref:Uncharacterized protein n=1 Tax=Cyphellophora attinorum TaxID=1664694 RepID=A0A0N1NYR1_9EURO|nr:uncharacterized protein AB675_8937 [Phialophora attinorum]KPI36130.1 hypothetical protein AB675_8937 [Phialophora attinorum]